MKLTSLIELLNQELRLNGDREVIIGIKTNDSFSSFIKKPATDVIFDYNNQADTKKAKILIV